MGNDMAGKQWDTPEGLLAFVYGFLYIDDVRKKIAEADTLEEVMDDYKLSDDAKQLFREADGKPMNFLYVNALASMVAAELVNDYTEIYERCW